MAEISSVPQPHLQQIDLTALTVPQLSTLKTQLDGELNLFQESLSALKTAQSKFQASAETVTQITPDTEGKEILVPLTGSMYVPGTLYDTSTVLIDIGTRYYVEKDLEAAKDYFKRKIQFITEQMEKVQTLGFEKSKIRDAVVEIMELKLQQQKNS